jgi:hypothetical protein
MSFIENVLSNEDLEWILALPEVIQAKNKGLPIVYFSIPLTNTIRYSLETYFQLNFPDTITQIPMRWIRGDTQPHIDTGSHSFENTYLAYLTDSNGYFIIDTNVYPIQSNTGFIFNEGTLHRTQDTGDEPRLLLGPMNEWIEPVGFTIAYYPTQADALAYTNVLGYGTSFTLGDGGPFGSYTQWMIASNTSGNPYPPNQIFSNGYTFSTSISYNVYPANTICFLGGSKILCLVDKKEQYISIEHLLPGNLVKTHLHGYKKIQRIGYSFIENPDNEERIQNRLYKCSRDSYPELTNDLYLTGYHSILVDQLTDVQRTNTMNEFGRLMITDDKYRLICAFDERSDPWNSKGSYKVWHLALEHEDERMNYGIYANGGLLVESCSLRFIQENGKLCIPS